MSGAGAARPPISGVVICFNEADRIGRCLESLAFCDEIVVVDSGSTDGTRDVARRHTERVIEQPFLGYVKQKNFALERAKHRALILERASHPEAGHSFINFGSRKASQVVVREALAFIAEHGAENK